MGKDYPDWGGHYNDPMLFPLDDLAELAARLGSPVTYDRRGNVLWLYAFEHGLGLVETANSASSVAALSTTRSEVGPFSCRLTTHTAADAWAYALRRVPRPVLSRVGFQVSVNFNNDNGLFQVDLAEYDGSAFNRARLRIDMDNRELQVNDAAAGWVAIATGLPDYTDAPYFIHMKLVVNLSDHTYVRAVVDNTEYDLSAYTMSASAGTTSPHLFCRAYLANAVASAAQVWVDSLIVTGSEPA